MAAAKMKMAAAKMKMAAARMKTKMKMVAAIGYINNEAKMKPSPDQEAEDVEVNGRESNRN